MTADGLPYILLLRICNDLRLHWVLQLLMHGRANSAFPMYPRASDQVRISWKNIHHKESRLKSLGTHFDRQVELSKHCSLRTIKSSYDYITGFHDRFLSIKSIESTLR